MSQRSSFYLSFQSSTLTPTSSGQGQGSGANSIWQYPTVLNQWSHQATEVKLESEEPACVQRKVATTTATTATVTTSISTSSCTTNSTGDDEAKGHRKEVKLPMNAVELIAWAILNSDTTTPTVTRIARHIQTHVSTYRYHDLQQLMAMVWHHLHSNQPTFFLPVQPSSSHLATSPATARWAVNRQTVGLSQDGSVVRRRQRHHPYKHPYLPAPHATATVSATEVGSNTSASFVSYPGSPVPLYSGCPTLGPSGPTSINGSTMSMLGTTMDGGGLQRPQSGTECGAYGLSLGAGGGGKMAASHPCPLLAYQWPF